MQWMRQVRTFRLLLGHNFRFSLFLFLVFVTIMYLVPFTGLAASLLLASLPGSIAAKLTSAFSLDTSQPSFTFHYATDRPSLKNWIGIYNSSITIAKDLSNTEDTVASVDAPWETGNVKVDIEGLPLGNYTAYYLTEDGRKALADPVKITLNFNSANPWSECQFSYYTDTPSDNNWVGIFPVEFGGPDNQTRIVDPIAKTHAPGRNGTAQLPTYKLTDGEYRAYYLQDDGYKWLASPVETQCLATLGHVSANHDDNRFHVQWYSREKSRKNWVGAYYAHGGGPRRGAATNPALSWQYASNKYEGDLKIDSSKLQPGLRYKLYWLADKKYDWISRPTEVFLPDKGEFGFLVKSYTTQSAQKGYPFTARIDGLLAGSPNGDTHFFKESGPSWLKVSSRGELSGIPTSFSTNVTQFTIQAVTTDGNRTSLELRVPVVEFVEELTVMSWNLWHGGTQVRDYHKKQVRFVASSGADIIGVQESENKHALRIAEALGWYSWQSDDVGIISRYPIIEVFPPVERAIGVRIRLDSGKEVIHWNTHLAPWPYGPEKLCIQGETDDEAYSVEYHSGRVGEMQQLVWNMRDSLFNADHTPVLLTGDMNAPSYLDWTNKTQDLHCGFGYVGWPASQRAENAGLIDSFREVHPDPVKEPGITWSPIQLKNGFADEPMDRVDFVYHKGMKTVTSETVVVGQPKPEPNHKDNEWTSDHAAVKSVFKLNRKSVRG